MISISDEKVLSKAGSARTIHLLIAQLHDSKPMRKLAAIVTVIAFTGLAAFEIIWGATALQSIFSGSDYLYYLTIFLLGFYLIILIWNGGQRAALNTDQYQVIFAYIGLHGVIGWMLYHHPEALGQSDNAIVFLLIVVLSGFAVLRRVINSRKIVSSSGKFLNTVAVISLGILIFSILLNEHFWKSEFSISFGPLAQMDIVTFFALLSFALLPLFYQFVDATNWQRVSAITQTKGNLQEKIKDGFRTFGLESPLSWLLPVAIGVIASTFLVVGDGSNPWPIFLDHIANVSGSVGALAGAFFIAGVVAVFLSTADALLTGVGYIIAFDIRKSTRDKMDTFFEDGKFIDQSDVVKTGRTWSAIAVLGVVVAFIMVSVLTSQDQGHKLIGFFLAFYAPMIVFAPCVFFPLIFSIRANTVFAYLSICLGVLFSSVAALVFLLVPDVNPIWEWLPVPIAFATSWGLYVVGLIVERNPIDLE